MLNPAMQAYAAQVSKDPTEPVGKRAVAREILFNRRRRVGCFITGRMRGFRHKSLFGMTRHELRQMGYLGLLPGVIKYSW